MSGTAFKQVANHAQTTLASSINNSVTSIAVASGEGARLPVTGNGWYAWIWDSATYPDPFLDSNREVVLVTARSTDTLTVTRAQKGTSAVSHGASSAIALMDDAANISDLQDAVNGLQNNIAIIQDQKSSGTAGQTLTSGAWRTCDLNTEVSDPGSIVSISTNQFSLGAGTYLINWRVPARSVNRFRTRCYNITDSAVAGPYSPFANCQIGGLVTESAGTAIITIAGTKAFEIQCYSDQTGDGGGGYSGPGIVEVYNQVIIQKLY